MRVPNVRAVPPLLALVSVLASCEDCSDDSSAAPPVSMTAAPEPADEPAAEVDEQAPSPAAQEATPVPNEVLDAGELYTLWRYEDIVPPRVFVILKRHPNRADYESSSSLWKFETWNTEYTVWPARRAPDPEPVTLFTETGTCVARATGLWLLRQPVPSWGGGEPQLREALEVEGCSFERYHYFTPVAVAGAHPDAQRVEAQLRYEEADARAQLRRFPMIVEEGYRAEPTLRGLQIHTYEEEGLRVVTTVRPEPEVYSGEVHSNDADQGETTFVLSGGRVAGTVPYYGGDALLRVGDRRYLAFAALMMNVRAYRVYEWTSAALTPVVEICEERFAFYLDPRCHRPFEEER